MRLKTKVKSRCSIGEWCESFWLNIKRHIHSLAHFIYNRDHKTILGRDGKQWSKLAAFYFFFYIALGGFFCLYLSIFMSLLPLNQPRCVGKDSRLTSRANPLSPGLSFRPQGNFDPNDAQMFISLSSNKKHRRKRSTDDSIETYIKNLDEFLKVYYEVPSTNNFKIDNVGDCNSINHYGFKIGKPCLLIKMNKIVSFIPEIGRTNTDNQHESACNNTPNIPVRCNGENPFDQDMLGDVIYYSESGPSDTCGSINIKHFPYNGKNNRNDDYQSPYVWVQFQNLTEHVLITVECRIFGANIFYDKIAQRGSIRFQLYLNKNS